MELLANPGKNLIIEVKGKKYARYPVKTHLITPNDKDIAQIIEKYAKQYLKTKDIVFISEKALSIIQGRSYPKNEIRPCALAKFLSRYVTKTPIGIGLGSPETMQLAIEEVGLFRIFLALVAAVLTKPFGIKGVFYIVAGSRARAIDGAVAYAIPPYNTYVSKGPVMADKISRDLSKKLGVDFMIIDANDFGVNILGSSRGVDRNLARKALRDNPLGQTNQQTPIGILRQVE